MSDLDLSLALAEGQQGVPGDGDVNPASEPTADERGNVVGQRLRDIRRQQGLSLSEVETRSGGVWKAVVVGAYERGDRGVTISRLAELAQFYGVPLASLLPARTAATPTTGAEPRRRRRDDGRERLKLDLQRLDDAGGEELDPIALRAVARFTAHIQRRRGDHNRRVLTVRRADLHTIAVAIGHDHARLIAALRAQGAIVQD